MWYTRQFDPKWVTCHNYKCRAEFTFDSIQRQRKCPKCKADNKHCLPRSKGAQK